VVSKETSHYLDMNGNLKKITMGKRDKEHRKKVVKRNERLKMEKRKMFEELKLKYLNGLSGNTENTFQIK
jgi:hypothetical protein